MRTRDIVYMDYNPDAEFWAHEKYIGNSDVDFITVNYKDNEACPQTAIDEIESYRELDPEWFKVYGLGQLGDLFKGKIFPTWEQIESNLYPDIDGYWYGLDFGFANDPTAVVKVLPINDRIYVDEIIYQTGLINRDIAQLIKQSGYKNEPVICDSAEPKSIQELRLCGINAIEADKGKGSVNEGIDFLKSKKILVTQRSKNLIKENKHYKWKVDRDGNVLKQPVDVLNHCFDKNTLITTPNGHKKIKDIKAGDQIINSYGIDIVENMLITGCREICEYILFFSNFSILLRCTKDHLIYTDKGWKQIQKICKGDIIYLSNFSMGKNIPFIKTRDILVGEPNGCIGWYMNTSRGKYPMECMYIILMAIRKTIISIISPLLTQINMFVYMVKKEQLIINNGLKNFIPRALKKQKNGMPVRMVTNGINNMQKNSILAILLMGKRTVRFAEVNLSQKNQIKNFVQTHANQNIEELSEQTISQKFVQYVEVNLHVPNTENTHIVQKNVVQKVEVRNKYFDTTYDLTIKTQHEFFANGVLVHNCIDALRYAFSLNRERKNRNESLFVKY